MNNQKAVLYDVEWQTLRVNTLTQNNEYGGWNTVEGVKENVNKLSTYILNTRDKQEYFYRLWRVLNMLNAVRMGYSGTKQVDTTQDNLVKAFRDDVSQEYHKRVDDGMQFDSWDWELVAKNLTMLKQKSPEDFNKIYKNLTGRRNTTEKNRGTLSFRPELVKFIELMDAVND